MIPYKLEDPDLIRPKEVGKPRSFNVVDHSSFFLIDRICAKVPKIFFERSGAFCVIRVSPILGCECCAIRFDKGDDFRPSV